MDDDVLGLVVVGLVAAFLAEVVVALAGRRRDDEEEN